ncbi:methyltransferase domain-containing protein [Clostridiaceae bacterium M8S5]|nr:methyltransferase domain-containing protein [Clostridiaceae bacterium M8S5]
MNYGKKCNKEHFGHYKKNSNRKGPSSFNMHDPELVFNKLNLREGDIFLDLGCGAGDYSMYASKIVGDSGKVYALDIWEDSLNSIKEESVLKGFTNIKTIVSDIKKPLPINNKSIDVCFIATVLHTLDIDKVGEKIFREINRILKIQGRLVIIECKKEDLPFGPPKQLRHSPEELEEIAKLNGFKKTAYVDLGYNYMVEFIAK